MKRKTALLLAIVLLFSMGMAGRAESNQTIVTHLAQLEIPAGVQAQVQDVEGQPVAMIDYNVDYCSVRIVLYSQAAQQFEAVAKGLGYDDPIAAQREFADMYFQNAFSYYPAAANKQLRQLTDWDLADGQSVTVRCDPALGVYEFLHHYGWIAMDVYVEYRNTGSSLQSISRMVSPLFRSLRKPYEEMLRGDDNALVAENTKVLRLKNAAFDVAESVAIEKTNDYTWLLSNDRYRIQLFFSNWDEAEAELGIDLKNVTDGDVQIDNFYALLLMMYDDADTALKTLNSSLRVNVEMPDGEPVIIVDGQKEAIVAHYYPHMGFMMRAEAADEKLDSAQLLNICKEIAVSFRPNGMSTQDLAAERVEAARQKAAELAARKYVIITGTNAFIRSGPGTNYPRIRTGLKGEEFIFLGQEGDWFKIEMNGQTAYINKGLSKIK